MSAIPFNKSHSSPQELVKLLQSRGLTIKDTVKAERYLSTIGYYRLTAYMYPFLNLPKSNHQFKSDSSFERVIMLYRFDKKLRLFIFNEIEKIEVAVRSTIVNVGCEMIKNSFWMTNPDYFTDQNKFNRTLSLIEKEIKHSREDFIEHFYATYSDDFPPAWVLAEVLPFGVITNIYSNILNKKIKKRISQTFDLQISPFQSWLTVVSLTRNYCCHHARMWNKQNTIIPMMPKIINHNWITLPTDKLRIYFDICIIKYFVDRISPNNNMTEKLHKLLNSFPNVDTAAMGFPNGWEKEPLWSE